MPTSRHLSRRMIRPRRSGSGSKTWTFRRPAGTPPPSARRPMPATRPWPSISTPASPAICACAPAARCRSTTSSAWRYRGHHQVPVFDLRRPDGRFDLRRLRRMRAGLPDRRADAEIDRRCRNADRHRGRLGSRGSIPSAPICGVGCQITYHIRDEKIAYVEGRNGPANENRLCVKGRFGFDYAHNPRRLTKPLIRKEGMPKGLNIDPANPLTHFREAIVGGGAGRRGQRPEDDRGGQQWRRGGGRLRVGEMLERGSLSVPEADPHRLRPQQCRPLHAALPRLVGGGTDGRYRLGRGDGGVHRGIEHPTLSSSSAPTRPSTTRWPRPTIKQAAQEWRRS